MAPKPPEKQSKEAQNILYPSSMGNPYIYYCVVWCVVVLHTCQSFCRHASGRQTEWVRSDLVDEYGGISPAETIEFDPFVIDQERDLDDIDKDACIGEPMKGWSVDEDLGESLVGSNGATTYSSEYYESSPNNDAPPTTENSVSEDTAPEFLQDEARSERSSVEGDEPTIWSRLREFLWSGQKDVDSDYDTAIDSYANQKTSDYRERPRAESSSRPSNRRVRQDPWKRFPIQKRQQNPSPFPLPSCSRFEPTQILNWRRIPDSSTVVLVTQCSVDRLAALCEQLDQWDGFASVCVYAAQRERDDLDHKIRKLFSAAGNVAVCRADQVVEDEPYPINFLRNTALLQAIGQDKGGSTKTHLLLLDVDFVPSANLREVLENRHATTVLENEVVVVPAFETKAETTPRTCAELKELVAEGAAEGFHIKSFPKGHLPTDYGRFWALSSAELDPNETWANAYSIDHAEGFEPYIVIPGEKAPLYDERFQGYGLNKISHIVGVAHSVSSTFKVLPGVFVVGKYHEPSKDWENIYGRKTKEASTLQSELRSLYDDFLERIKTGLPVIVSTRTMEVYEKVFQQDHE